MKRIPFWSCLGLCFLLCSLAKAQFGGMDPSPEDCKAFAQRMKDDCLAKGGDPVACEAMAQRILAGCDAIEPPPPPVTVTCEDRCSQMYEQMKAQCNGDAACLAKAEEALAKCTLGCNPPLPGGCREACYARFEAAKAQCMPLPRDRRDACMADAKRELDACLKACSPEQPPEPRPCVEQ
jgi:hypothetical protein